MDDRTKTNDENPQISLAVLLDYPDFAKLSARCDDKTGTSALDINQEVKMTLLDLLHKQEFKQGQRMLLRHAGGSFALFGYDAIFDHNDRGASPSGTWQHNNALF